MKHVFTLGMLTPLLLLASCGHQVQQPEQAQGNLTSQNAFCGNKSGGGRSATYYDSSVSNVAAFGQDYTSLFDQARAQWSGISSQVALNKTSYNTNNPDIYYVGRSSDTTVAGITFGYDYVNGTLTNVSLDAYWVKATVTLYDNSFDAANYNNTQRLATTIHELGHSLKLAHPNERTCRVTPIPSGQTSVMVQGPKSYGVQQYDAAELKGVWGL